MAATNITTTPATYAETLLSFCEKIGVNEQAVKDAETPLSYRFRTDISSNVLKGISEQELMLLLDTFGESLSLRIGDPDGPALLQISDGRDVDPIPRALQNVQEMPDELIIAVDLLIDKSHLLRRFQLASDQCYGLFYLFKDRLARWLESSLLDLDANLYKHRHHQTIIAVDDGDFCYSGPFLIIVGVKQVQSKPPQLFGISQKLKERVERYVEAADHLNWQGFGLNNLTPVHFLVNREVGEVNVLDSILQAHLLRLCILYTANRSFYNEKERSFQAFYASSEKTVELSISPSNDAKAQLKALTRAALWPYDGKGTDRLTIFQNTVARETEGDKPPESFAYFTRHLQHLLDEARWHYRMFIDNEISKHFDRVQAANTYIASVTKEVASTIDSMTKAFTDALFSAIGVIALTILAAVVKNEIRDDVFRISLIFYSGYLLIVAVYRLVFTWQNYNLLQHEMTSRLTEYRQAFGTARLKDLVSPYEKRKRQFWEWFTFTVVAYLVLLLGAWTGPRWLPTFLESQGVQLAATATPTVTPMATKTAAPTSAPPGSTPVVVPSP